MMLAKSSTAGTGETTLVKSEPGLTTIMEGSATSEEVRALKLRGWCITNEEPALVGGTKVEILDKASGTVLAHAFWEKTTSALSSQQFMVPQGIKGGPDGINISSGEIVVKRTGKSTVTVYYEQQ